ncbi:MAG: DUF4388 domain-containing protein [Desulfobacteraceae bacterium]|nr:DUF4388 domain-containing protein [Desulfobacteraceae bacterium]MBC2754762.1 DUF4388 domain-containing protein [Desulfobacteraceae bacterium]
MDFKESSFKIIKNHNCPFYQNGDEFKVVGRSISLMGKPTCLTLMSDVMAALVNCQGIQTIIKSAPREHVFNCSGYQSGCPGTIRLKYLRTATPAADPIAKIDKELSDISQELNNFSIFKTLSDHEVKEIVSYFKVQELKKGQIILRKGDRGENLFIILSGEVEIVGDYGIAIAKLGRGEIFGEMSLLTGNPVSTKVKVVEDTKTMCMSANYFKMILSRFSPLQMYFTRLLARRLAKSNIERSKQISSGMSGNLSEITATELLQALNMTQKTGVLKLNFPKGEARISLRDGHIVHAEFREITGEKAFFEIMKQKRGNFKFKPGLPPNEMNASKIADFMYLMMEAMNRIDEESHQPEAS